MKHFSFSVTVVILVASLGIGAEKSKKIRPAKPSLTKALAALKIPPPWFARTTVQWKTSQPWKKGRIEIRRLLGLGTAEGNNQAVKLTYLYREKRDIGNGHEWPMYLFMGGQTAWATRAYEEFIGKNPERNTHAYIDLMSCYRTFGEYAKAKATARQAMKNLPTDKWRVSNQANVYEALGDLYAELGDKAQARKNYVQAAALYPKSKQPYGRHLLARRVKKVRGKIDLLDIGATENTTATRWAIPDRCG
jgi:tetratricopeptide (TPR) repeat protein